MSDQEEVKIIDFSSNNDTYSDGDIENEILEIFKDTNSKQKVLELLEKKPSWPMLYHLSPARENILNWFDFKKDSSLLEIGAGCGALTGLFCNSVRNVTAIELSKRRAEIILNRHKDKKNLTIYAGNLNDISLPEKYDYITLIGVLEYAGKFTHTEEPFKLFLKNVKKNLNKNGTLIVGIENKFGLKYWAGGREDHTGGLFESMEGYPDKKEIQTFGKEEIKKLFLDAGYEKIDFYYPMPDYKFPTELFSDEYQPTLVHNIRSGVFPIQDLSQPREFLFNEKLVMDNIIENKQFDFFANSFLVFVQ